MSLYVTEGTDGNSGFPKRTNFELPTAGVHPLECVSIKASTRMAYDGGQEQRIEFLFLVTDEKQEDGHYKTVFQSFRRSMHEKSALRKFLIALGIEHPERTDLETLQYAMCMGVVTHNRSENNGKVYPNVQCALPSTLRILSAEERAVKKEDNKQRARQGQRN